MNSGFSFVLKLLGNPSLEGDDGVALDGRAAQRHRIALLALLARAPVRGLSREKLMTYLWPESDPERARNLLNVSVYVLRRALGEDALLSGADDLRLNVHAVRTDVVEFEAAVAGADHERAAAVYEGPFLDGFFLGRAPEFEEWVERERQRLAASYAKTLEALARAAEARGDFAAAAERWKARAVHDPYDSRVARSLIEALAAGGNRAAALQHAETHERLLREEFGVESDPVIQAAREVLRRRSVMPDNSAEPVFRAEVVEDVVGQVVPSTDAAPGILGDASPRAGGRRRRRVFHWSGGAVAAALAAWGVIALVSSPDPLRSRVAPPTVGWEGDGRASRPFPARSIAVLPFVSLSPDSAEEYLSDGLAEELIGTLARIDALRVASRTSSFAFKGETRDIRQIGEALNVATVVEGSVRTDGDRLLVTAQLIDISDGFHLWSGTYERRLTDIFVIQRDLALQIAGALEAKLTPKEREVLARRPTENLEAYTAYLKGRHFWNRRTGGGLGAAIEYFQRAIELDPGFAAGYAGLASVYPPLAVLGYVTSSEARDRMRVAALRAVELGPELAEAHMALAAFRHVYEWDWAAAEREYRRAIELDPSQATAYHWYGYLLEALGRFDENIAARETALGLDPLVAIFNSGLGSAHRVAGHLDRAAEHYRDALELDPGFWLAHEGLGKVYELEGDLDRAIRSFELAVTNAGATPRARATLARALARAGRLDDARRMLRELEMEAAASGINDPVVATVHLALGDREAALRWLDRSYRQRHPYLTHLAVEAGYAGLRDDPRFVDLLDRIGLPH